MSCTRIEIAFDEPPADCFYDSLWNGENLKVSGLGVPFWVTEITMTKIADEKNLVFTVVLTDFSGRRG